MTASSEDPFVGTWVLNFARSTFTPGQVFLKETLLTEDLTGGQFRSTINSLPEGGPPLRIEIVYAIDGRDYAVLGSPYENVCAYHRIDDRTIEIVPRQDGRVPYRAIDQISEDGLTQTMIVKGVTAGGESYTNIAIYDRQ